MLLYNNMGLGEKIEMSQVDEIIDRNEIALRKSCIEKTKDGSAFIGDYQDLLTFKSKGNFGTYDWLD